MQAYGKATWDHAPRSPITAADVRVAAPEAEAELAVGFFGSRYERATPAEREYMRAMAALSRGADAERPDDMPRGADRGGRPGARPQAGRLSPARDALIKKGLIYSGERGTVAFTVPHFGRYLRTQPGVTGIPTDPGRIERHRCSLAPRAREEHLARAYGGPSGPAGVAAGLPRVAADRTTGWSGQAPGRDEAEPAVEGRRAEHHHQSLVELRRRRQAPPAPPPYLADPLAVRCHRDRAERQRRHRPWDGPRTR